MFGCSAAVAGYDLILTYPGENLSQGMLTGFALDHCRENAALARPSCNLLERGQHSIANLPSDLLFAVGSVQADPLLEPTGRLSTSGPI